MSNEAGVYVELQKLSDNHSNLSTYFSEFLSSSGARFEEVTGIELDLPPPSGDSFGLQFAGRRLEFRFSSALTVEGAPVGIVTCFGWKHPSHTKPYPVTRFTFNADGLIRDVPRPDHLHNVLRIDNASHAVYLLAHCLRCAVSEPADPFE